MKVLPVAEDIRARPDFADYDKRAGGHFIGPTDVKEG
jgi:hypothetical protein